MTKNESQHFASKVFNWHGQLKMLNPSKWKRVMNYKLMTKLPMFAAESNCRIASLGIHVDSFQHQWKL